MVVFHRNKRIETILTTDVEPIFIVIIDGAYYTNGIADKIESVAIDNAKKYLDELDFEEVENILPYEQGVKKVKGNGVLPCISTRTYDEDFDEVDCEHYEYEVGLEDNAEICHLGIGIENCSHCFKNKKLYVC